MALFTQVCLHVVEARALLLVTHTLQEGDIEWEMEQDLCGCFAVRLVACVAGVWEVDACTEGHLEVVPHRILLTFLVILVVEQIPCKLCYFDATTNRDRFCMIPHTRFCCSPVHEEHWALHADRRLVSSHPCVAGFDRVKLLVHTAARTDKQVNTRVLRCGQCRVRLIT